MNSMTNSEFEQFAKGLAASTEKFIPTATYDPDGDCIEFVARPDSFYAERIDDLVTVYYSHETNEIIGSLIKNVSHFYKIVLDKFPGFRIEVQDGMVRLEHLFLAKLWSSAHETDEVVVLKYRKLIAVAEESQAQAQLCEA
jgi:hypothetical protein